MAWIAALAVVGFSIGFVAGAAWASMIAARRIEEAANCLAERAPTATATGRQTSTPAAYRPGGRIVHADAGGNAAAGSVHVTSRP